MTKIDKTDIENIKLIIKETKIGNVLNFKIKKGDYEIEISSQTLNAPNIISEAKPQISQQNSEEKTKVENIKEENIVKSPMVGVAYLSADPNSSPYVKIGQHVKAGDILLPVSYTHLTLPTTPYV